jgi:hypothetical protein
LRNQSRKPSRWAKEWTIEAANHAAHTDKMGLSMVALAKAHGVAEEAANKSVEAVKKVGFSTEDAIHAVDPHMISDMNLSKAQGLAKVAKDAAAIENITPGEALEKLFMSIESGASLRTMGIFVDLNKEVEEVARQEKLTGKTLDENEIRQLRYNAVMREGAKTQGAAAAASGSAEAQSKALAREVIGKKFQGYAGPRCSCNRRAARSSMNGFTRSSRNEYKNGESQRSVLATNSMPLLMLVSLNREIAEDSNPSDLFGERSDFVKPSNSYFCTTAFGYQRVFST